MDAVERKIREAIERGEFDALPGSGQPLDSLDRPYDPNWWVKEWVERDRSVVRSEESLAAIERQARRLWACADRSALDATLADINRQRTAAGLEELDAGEVTKLWADVRRHRS